jgi:phytoene synthase
MPHSPDKLAVSFQNCRLATRHHAKSFYFASHALPQSKRQAAYAVYAFCRHADDLLDERDLSSTPAQHAYETELGDLLDRLYAGTETQLHFGPAFHHTVKAFGIPLKPFQDLVHGVCLDQQPLKIRDWAELQNYCYHVASVVGLVMCPILGLRNPAAEAHAIELGIAMQLTNILRDIREDFERGRIYLPADERARFGIGESELAQGKVTPQFVALMQYQIERARNFYRRSEAGITDLAADGSQLTVWLMRWVYSGILEEIERAQYDVFRGRVSVSTPRKLALAFRALRSCHAQR